MDSSSGTPTVVSNGAPVTPVACRWNPTKEQINMLESLYVQGLTTPTVEQIQEITKRLQTYGHIEGKNVFYWFQNHKARQRQKEKQDRISLIRQYNHLNNRHRSMPNAVYKPQNNLGFYKRRSPRSTRLRSKSSAAGLMLMHSPENEVVVGKIEEDETVNGKKYSDQETLNLFPLHPTASLEERVGIISTTATGSGGCLASRVCTSSLSGDKVDQMYFDFFC